MQQNTINIQGKDYTLDFSRFYLNNAEKYLNASKSNKNREEEYLKKAEELIHRSKIASFTSQENINAVNDFTLKKKPTTKFSDVAGLEELKERIKLKVIEPLKNPELFKLFGKKFGGGILMYGPPGCGKSFIAEATAGEAKVHYFNVKASDIKGKYVGETEQNITRLFKIARENQPCIIFFDEFEALGRERNDAVGHDKAMVSQLLTEIDSVGNKNQQIMVLAATNEPWSIDLALRREGRFGNTLFVPPPDLEGRATILKNNLKDKPLEDDFDFEFLAKITDLYSGADLIEVCNTAIENVLSHCLEKKAIRKITTDDLLKVIHKKKELITLSWFRKALEIIHLNNNQDSFNELIEYTSKIGKNEALVY